MFPFLSGNKTLNIRTSDLCIFSTDEKIKDFLNVWDPWFWFRLALLLFLLITILYGCENYCFCCCDCSCNNCIKSRKGNQLDPFTNHYETPPKPSSPGEDLLSKPAETKALSKKLASNEATRENELLVNLSPNKKVPQITSESTPRQSSQSLVSSSSTNSSTTSSKSSLSKSL